MTKLIRPMLCPIGSSRLGTRVTKQTFISICTGHYIYAGSSGAVAPGGTRRQIICQLCEVGAYVTEHQNADAVDDIDWIEPSEFAAVAAERDKPVEEAPALTVVEPTTTKDFKRTMPGVSIKSIKSSVPITPNKTCAVPHPKDTSTVKTTKTIPSVPIKHSASSTHNKTCAVQHPKDTSTAKTTKSIPSVPKTMYELLEGFKQLTDKNKTMFLKECIDALSITPAAAETAKSIAQMKVVVPISTICVDGKDTKLTEIALIIKEAAAEKGSVQSHPTVIKYVLALHAAGIKGKRLITVTGLSNSMLYRIKSNNTPPKEE